MMSSFSTGCTETKLVNFFKFRRVWIEMFSDFKVLRRKGKGIDNLDFFEVHISFVECTDYCLIL
jgi:hypothetical protein